MLMRKLLLGATALLLAGSVLAGEISPGLKQILDATDDDTPVKAMIFMREQVDIEALNQELSLAKATRASRHYQVVPQLQGRAELGQPVRDRDRFDGILAHIRQYNFDAHVRPLCPDRRAVPPRELFPGERRIEHAL